MFVFSVHTFSMKSRNLFWIRLKYYYIGRCAVQLEMKTIAVGRNRASCNQRNRMSATTWFFLSQIVMWFSHIGISLPLNHLYETKNIRYGVELIEWCLEDKLKWLDYNRDYKHTIGSHSHGDSEWKSSQSGDFVSYINDVINEIRATYTFKIIRMLAKASHIIHYFCAFLCILFCYSFTACTYSFHLPFSN